VSALREVLGEIRRWYAAGEAFALATVVGTFRSAPRQPGAAMAVAASGP
jgi:xanthine dehydrogenase accessory factor